MQKNKRLWILTDRRIGNANQARNLAKLMGWKGRELPMNYSLWASLPNWLPFGLCRLMNKCRKEMLSMQPPEIIISSGRRTAAIALEIKKLCPKIQLVQIMHPELPLKFFDVVILPEHDKKPDLMKNEHIVWIAGAVSNIDKAMLDDEAKKLYGHYEIKPDTEICSIMLGGATRGRSITHENIDEMMAIVLRYTAAHKALLMISTSRRTSSDIVKYLTEYVNKHAKGRVIIHNYSPKSDYNPYWGMIAASSRVIATADSISMCSEIVNCGKQLFIYGRKNMLAPKHERFMQSLIGNGLAKNLVFGMSGYKTKFIDQSEKIVKAVAGLLG